MQIIKTKETRWLSYHTGNLLQKIRNFHDSNFRFNIETDCEYVYDSEIETHYLAAVFFFRYSRYAILILTSEVDINEQCFVFRLSKVVPAEGDGWYCRKQFEAMISDELTSEILYSKSDLEDSIRHVVHLNCLDELTNMESVK